MNNDSPFTAIGDEPVEARIVAWVLGEASAFEAAELERLCQERPELLVFRRRMRALHGLLTEAEAAQPDEGWKLPAEKRKILDEVFNDGKIVSSDVAKEKRIHHSGRRALLAIAACLVLTVVILGLTAPMVMRQRKKADIKESPMIVAYSSMSEEQDGIQPAAPAKDMVPLSTRLPEELIEGTPKPMNVPNLEVPTDGPAGSRSWREKSRVAAESNERFQRLPAAPAMPEDKRKTAESRDASDAMVAKMIEKKQFTPARPAAPSSAMAKGVAANATSSATIPVPDGDVTRPSLDFGDGSDFAAGFGSDQPSGNRSGDGAIALNSTDALPNNPNQAESGKIEAGEGIPVLDSLIEKSGGKSVPSEPDEKAQQVRDYSSLAEREMVRRQDAVSEGERLLTEGRDAYAKGDYQQAVDKFSRSREKFPDAPMGADRRDASHEHLNDASVALAAQNRKVGKYDEARSLLKNVISADPSNEEAKRELEYLEDPIRTSPALTYEHTENVDKVRRNLYMAEGNYNLGKYDDARKEYENVLRADPFNSAARSGLERVASAKTDYYRAAYDHTRAELLMEVDKAWELSVPADVASNQDRAKLEDYQQYNLTGKFSAMREAKSSGDAVFPTLSSSLAAGFEQSMDFYDGDSTVPPPDFEGFVNSGAPIAGHKNIPASEMTIVREFQYPTEYEPPVLPQVAASDAAFPTTPDTPAPWTGKDEGMKYELHGSSSSAYAFRGMDLGKLEAAPAPVPLVDLMEEIAATEDPYSTFSLNISDASFQVAQAALAKGERPDPAGIKVEQFYNAVDYGDPAPAGGEPVAVSIEQSAHPVIPGRDLVRVALKTAAAGRSAAQPLRLTLLVDQSGSMVREDRRVAMDKALAGLSTLLTDKDLVTVIGFSRIPRLLADGRPGDKLGKLADLVNQSASEGGTNLEEAIKLAEQLADRHKLATAQNRIVLFTDGAANLGNADPVRLAEKVKVLRQKGIAFDIAGIAADGLNDELLAELARNGNGRYYVVGKGGDDNLAKQLAGAFRPAAENVKVQVRFNPQRVGRYKLIGFEKDRLKTEDFRNDAVDAAELAAAEAGVAIYQIETLPGGNGEIGEVSVRFRDAASAQMVERTWTISHDEKSPAFDQATPSMQLATLSMLAAEKLKGGPLADAIDFKQFADPRANVKRFYGNNGRVGEVLNMVDALK